MILSAGQIAGGRIAMMMNEAQRKSFNQAVDDFISKHGLKPIDAFLIWQRGCLRWIEEQNFEQKDPLKTKPCSCDHNTAQGTILDADDEWNSSMCGQLNHGWGFCDNCHRPRAT